MGDDDMIIDEAPAVVPLSMELEKQISNAINPGFLSKLVCYFDISYRRWEFQPIFMEHLNSSSNVLVPGTTKSFFPKN